MDSHCYQWDEAVAAGEAGNIQHLRLKHLSMDVLLPGATNERQIKAEVDKDGMSLILHYRPPSVFFSSRRSAVRTSNGEINTARIKAHETEVHRILSGRAQNQGFKKYKFPLPVRVDRNFTMRDDYGVEGQGDGMQIGIYQHHDERMQALNQWCYILHLEMTLADRPETTAPSTPTFGFFVGDPPNQNVN